MTATLEVKATACLDPYVLACSPAIDLRGLVEKKLRECVVHAVLGDLESERSRLRAAVEKWGRRALNRKHWKDSEGEEDELKEDMK